MSVAQLAELAKMDVDSVVTLVLRQSGKAAAAAAPKAARRGPGRPPKAAAAQRPAKAPKAAAPSASGGHNTRTKEGRDVLDTAILTFLQNAPEPVRALDIRREVGGTAAQVRTRLNYLISKNKVSYKGRASGTRYTAK